MAEIAIPSRVNPDLQKERDTRSFNVEELTHILDGGPTKTRKRRHLMNVLFSDPSFQHPEDRYFLSSEERYVLALKNGIRLLELKKEHGLSDEDIYTIQRAIGLETPLLVPFVMFIPALEKLGTAEQAARWVPLAKSLQIIGTYGQTEIAHGTNLRKLQTRADYDVTTDEFVLNTPLPAGMKWWPGGLGKSCNHVLLLAQLYAGGRNCGMQAFMVPIRDMETHRSLPGIEVGDVGPRYNPLPSDNGYLILNNVRIPRENMMARNAEVTREGKFVSKATGTRDNYSTMVFVRTMYTRWSSLFTAICATIATRYSAVRRQSELDPKKPEVQVLDFQTQQYKLFPNIALAYALLFAKNYMHDSYNYITEQELKKGIFDNMPELHIQSCGLKAYVTDQCTEAAEVLRRACGGHGYLMASGIAPVLLTASGQVPTEGENTVLYLQVARHLVKCFSGAAAGKTQRGSTAYYNQEPVPRPIRSAADCDNLQALCRALQGRAYWTMHRVAKRYQTALANGAPQYTAWNDNCVDLVNAAKYHVDFFVTENYVKNVREVNASEAVRQVMTSLCQLHALHRIVVGSGDFLQCGVLSSDEMDLVRQRELSLLPRLRPDAVSLVDAFDLHDNILQSALGSYDGNVYERLFATAKKSPMNKTDVHPSYYKYIKPIQNKAKL